MDAAELLATLGGMALIVFTIWFFFGEQKKIEVSGQKEPYACPMHPWITSGDPMANCSICGMKLVRSDDTA
jgi:hypothetical protein